ncbi:hypothetical protein SALBM311S_04949 [Streptomyces alboniger]
MNDVILSRIAEALTWTGRYVERADNTGRILDAYLHRMLEDPWRDEDVACRSLYAILGVDAGDERVDMQQVLDQLQYGSAQEAAAASAGGRHSAMTRAILRGYDLTDRPDPRGPAARQRLHGYIILELSVVSATAPGQCRSSTARNSGRPRFPATELAQPMTWITTPLTEDLLRGALDVERTEHGLLPHRLPARARAQCADPAAGHGGVPTLRRTAGLPHPGHHRRTGHPPPRAGLRGRTAPPGRCVRTARRRSPGGPGQRERRCHPHHRHDHQDHRAPARPHGTVRFTGLPGTDKNVEIWLPHNETTELVALRTNTPVEPRPTPGPPGLAAPRQLHQPQLRTPPGPPPSGPRSPLPSAGRS